MPLNEWLMCKRQGLFFLICLVTPFLWALISIKVIVSRSYWPSDFYPSKMVGNSPAIGEARARSVEMNVQHS